MIKSFKMIILKKNNMYNKLNLFFLTKIYTTGKPLKYGTNIDISLDIKTHRSLAKHEKGNELMNSRIIYQTHDNRENYKLSYGKKSRNTYEQLKRGRSNRIEAYLKCYNQRYAKKKGLKKWDCYCEKKVFDKIDKIVKYIEQKNINEKNITKVVFKKYGLPLILLSLIPLFGIIIPILTINNDHIVKKCGVQIISKGNKKYYRHRHDNCTLFPIGCVFLNNIIFSLSVFTIIFLIIYTIIKVAKYERIKAGY
ncbi:Plasmodium exported protein, unknown function [Plasmodium vivax]|uniref:Variable surface protein n=1 Tax=Plasmodium vivax TaxID=5855 RepID=A0A565A423_PLAVI|nr:Plasmodium exported protein, unknown function [Plasmodium vivax]